jgi:hypothetical protein
MPYKPYVPKSLSELYDFLGFMMLASPTFKDRTGFLRHQNLDNAFLSLNESLLALRDKLGEERYATLSGISAKMRPLFEADPDDVTGDTRRGQKLIREMEEILKGALKRKATN